MLAVSVFEVLENLCTALQGRRTTVSGMLQAVSQTTSRLQEMRCNSHFLSLHEAAENSITAFCLEGLTLPRQCRPPRRREYTNNNQHVHDSPASYYKTVYFAAIDTALQSIQSRFDHSSFSIVKQVEECVLTGTVADILRTYLEIDMTRLAVQLPMFRSSFQYSCIDQAVTGLQASSHEVQQLFCEVEKLLQLLLVLPVSSCDAERSFSSLRRLKTYLRSTMTQTRLNSVAVLHVHQSELMSVPLDYILKDFVSLNSQRMQTFGSI